MPENFITKKEKITFREIILQHLKDILKISQSEFSKGGYTLVKRDGTTEYIPDARECYIQSIENFSYVLIPFFDKKIQEKYNKLIKDLQMGGFELSEKYGEEFWEKYEVVNKKLKISGKEFGEAIDMFCLTKKLRKAKELFMELNLLLKRLDYLKGLIYGEGAAEGDEIKDIDQE
ncbi:hypothetical protein ES702_04447 [subsurface metagenome]